MIDDSANGSNIEEADEKAEISSASEEPDGVIMKDLKN